MKRGRQVRLFSDLPPRTLPTLKIQVEFLPLLLPQVNVNGMVNKLRGVREAPFIVLIGRFLGEIRAGTLITAFQRIRGIIPQKMSLNRLRWGRPIHGFGQTPTKAVWAHLRPVHSLWAPCSGFAVPGLGWSVCSVKWASFGCVTQTSMFCVILLCLLRVFMLFPTCVPANQESPKLVEMVSNKPYSYVW